jgi:hypothetical protein
MRTINDLLDEFIQKGNDLVFSGDLRNNINKTHIRNHYIENSIGSEVLMFLGSNIVFTANRVLIFTSEGGRVIPKDLGLENKAHKLKKIGSSSINHRWFQYVFEIQYSNFHNLKSKPVTGGNLLWRKESDRGYLSFENKLITYIGKDDNAILPLLKILQEQIRSLIISNEKEEERQREKTRINNDKKEKYRVKKLKINQNQILQSLDKDGNGEVDAVEGNDFNTLLKKHQKTILEIDRNYVKKFVKISTYLKDKKANIQDIFNSIGDTPNESVLNEYVGILKNEVNTYHMILANGLTMLVALIEDDVITYEEIYESIDRINLFDSQWEKDVSQKLTNIGDGLNALMYEIEASNRRIVNELSNLTYATEQGFSELNGSITSELQSIDSSIKFNNLLTGIQTYQMYKINKNTKSLRG